MILYNKNAENRTVISLKIDDPVYYEFRENIKLRDEFKQQPPAGTMSRRQSIWKALDDVEQDTKERNEKHDFAQQEKARKLRNLLTCRCLFGKKITPEQKEYRWLKGRNKRILT
jgi:hypothetical protein